RIALPYLSRCPAGCRVALPCPLRCPAGCRVALPCQSHRPAGCRVALLPARRIAACAEPPCCPHRPAARRPAARAALLLPALLRAALLVGALLPARRPAGSRTAAHTALPTPPWCHPPCCAQPCWPTPCCPRAALLAATPPCPAHVPPCWPPPCPTLAARHSSLAVLLVALHAHPSLRGVPPPPFAPPTLLLLLLASLVLRMSVLLLLLVQSTATARARVARVVAVAVGMVVVEAVEAVEVAKVVATVGEVAGVGASVVVVVVGAAMGVGVAVVAAVGVVGVELLREEVLAVTRGNTSSSVGAREWFAQRGAFGGSVRCLYLELLRSGVDIFALDYDAILAAMYAFSVSAEGNCYLCVPPDPGIEAATLGASESFLHGTMPAEALHTFTLDSGASRCFFRDSTTLTPLTAPVLVRLADPSRGPVLDCSSTILSCPAIPSGSL
ncbi:unnamed protein product, partial [Closterium sp. NIES-54]